MKKYIIGVFFVAAQAGMAQNIDNLTGQWMGEIEKLPCWQKTQGAVEKALLPGAGA